MKNSNFIKNSIIALLPISLGLAVLFGIPSLASKEVFGYTESNLPTTIDLNDTSAETIRNYYSSADGKNGNNLLIELKKIISNGQKYYKYDSSNKIWQIYEIADRDWELSPASSTTYGTYDSKTNKITNYVYGSNDDGKNNPYLHALYVNRDATNLKRAWGDHGNRNSEATIEREHIWPKSHGFDSGTAAGARGDPMHLWAADGTSNGDHSNNFYGYVDKTKSYKDSGTKFASLSGNLSGFSKTLGGTQTIFEPQDSDKGDIARACFYMVARYNNLADDAEFIDGSEPNLCLINDLSKNGQTGQSTKTEAYGLGILDDLLEWNKLDPVDEYERHRNDLLYTNFTNNRNPFIDFPQWADIIWGDKTGTASPSTDPINNGQSEATCTGIEITTKPSKLSYKVGQSIDLTGMVVTAHYSDGHSYVVTDYTYSPSGALKKTDKELVVTYNDKTASCSISVTGESGEIPDATILTSPNMGLTGEYNDGSSSSLNVEWVKLRNGTNNVIQGTGVNSSLLYNIDSNNFAIDKIKFNIANQTASSNNAKINICFGDAQKPTTNSIQVGGGDDSRLATKNSSFTITNPGDGEYFSIAYKVNAVYFSSIEISYKKVSVIPVESVSLSSNSLDFEMGDRIKLVATVLPENATNTNVSWASTNDGVASVDDEGNVVAIGPGTATISVTTEDGNKTAECLVQVAEPIVETGISIDPSSSQKVEFFVGEEFTSEGLKVNLSYSDGSKEDVTDNCEISAPNMQTSGQKDVNISYGTFSTSYKITVSSQNLVVFDIPTMGFKNEQEIGKQTDSSSSFNFICSKDAASNAPKYYNTGSSIRFYGKNSLIICGPYKVIEVKLVFDSSDPSDNPITVSSGTYVDQKGGTGIWTGSDDFVKFTFGGASKHRRVSKIYIKYDSQSASNLLTGIELSGTYKTSYYVGEAFSSEGLVTTAKYVDQTSKTVTPSFSGFDSTASGEKTITVSFTENSRTVTTTYKVTVSDYALSSLVVSGTIKNEFFVGDEFSHEGLVATAFYEDGSSRDVSNSDFLTFDEPDLTVAGEKDVNVYYTENDVTKSDSYSITVYNIEPKSLEIITKPLKLSYFVGETFSADGIAAKVTYNNNDTKDVDEKDLTFTNYDMSKAGNYDVLVTYNEGLKSVTDEFEITVNKIELTSISVKTEPVKTTYYQGQQFDSTGLTIEASYNNGDKKTLSSGFTLSGFDSSKPSSALPITISYTEDGITKQTTFNVEVIELEFESLSLSGTYKTSFLYDTDFSSSGLKATLTYNSGETKDVSNSVTVTGYDMKKVGDQTITVSYKEGQNTISTSYVITVNAITPTSLTLSGSYKTTFEYGEEFTYEGLIARAIYDNGKTYEVTPTSVTGYDGHVVGKQTITVSYNENGATVSKTYQIEVTDKLESISLSGTYQTEFTQGDNFNSRGLVVTAHYTSGATKVVTPSEISGYNNSVVGEHTVTVSYVEDGVTVQATYVTKVNKKAEPTPEPKDNKVVIIVAAAGAAVVVGGVIIGISIGVHKKHKRRGK